MTAAPVLFAFGAYTVSVGRETFWIIWNGLPATSSPASNVSAGGLGSASGTAPGQSGIWVCPGDGCQTSACALAGANARAIQAATIEEQSGTNLGAVTMASRILAARQSAAKQPATTAEAQAW